MKSTVGILILLLSLLASCGNGDTWQRMDTADSLIEQYPDSALTILQSIDSTKITGAKLRARHALLTIQARVKTYRNSISDTAALPLLDYYSDHGPDFDRMRAAFYKAEIYSLTNNNGERIKSLLHAEDIASKINDNYWLAKIYEQKALIYNSTGYLQESIDCAKKASALYRTRSMRMNEAFLYGDIANIYYNSADFQKSNELLDSIQILFSNELRLSETLRIYLLDLKISNLVGEHKFLQADSLIRVFKTICPNPDWHQLRNYIYIQIYSDTTGVKDNLAKLSQLSKNPSTLSYYFRTCYDYYCLRAEWLNAKNAVDSALYYQDIAIREALKQSIISTQLDIQTARTNKLENKNQKLLYALGLSAGLTILLIIAYKTTIIRVKNRRDAIVNDISSQLAAQQLLLADYRQNAEQQIAKLNHSLAESESKNDKNDKMEISVTDNCLNHLRLRDIFSSQSGTLSTICLKYVESLNSEEKTATYNEIIKTLQALNSAASLTQQEKNINEAYNNILVKFKSDFPKIYQDNYGLLILLITRTKPRLIALILQKPEQTIYTKRKRIVEEIRKSSSPHKDVFLSALG